MQQVIPPQGQPDQAHGPPRPGVLSSGKGPGPQARQAEEDPDHRRQAGERLFHQRSLLPPF